jgi:hypothetical protein
VQVLDDVLTNVLSRQNDKVYPFVDLPHFRHDYEFPIATSRVASTAFFSDVKVQGLHNFDQLGQWKLSPSKDGQSYSIELMFSALQTKCSLTMNILGTTQHFTINSYARDPVIRATFSKQYGIFKLNIIEFTHWLGKLQTVGPQTTEFGKQIVGSKQIYFNHIKNGIGATLTNLINDHLAKR